MRRAAGLLLVLLAAACTGAGHGAPQAARHPSPAPTFVSASPAPTADIAVAPASFTGAFQTPSGNVTCAVNGYVECQVWEHTWQGAASDGRCRTTAVFLGEQGVRLDPWCASRAEQAGPVLPYGQGFEVGQLRCVSLPEGLDCRRLGTTAGFLVSRTALRTSATNPAPPVHRRVVDPRHVVTLGLFTGAFRTPTKNLMCHVAGDAASCYARQPPFGRPADAPSCSGQDDGDPTAYIAVEGTGPGEVFGDCWSDFPYGDSEEGPVLAYGSSWQLGDVQCLSQTRGVTCTNRRTHHGFFLNKASYRLF